MSHGFQEPWHFLCAGAHRGICCLHNVRSARRAGGKLPCPIAHLMADRLGDVVRMKGGG